VNKSKTSNSQVPIHH